MRTFFGIALLALGLVAVPVVAGADPIGTNGCTAGEVFVCDIYADYEVDGASPLGFSDPMGYLVAYTFLLNQTADLSDGFQISEVAHILVVHDALFQLFSNTVVNSEFGGVFASALDQVAIDGTSLSAGQILGCPVPGGVTSLGNVGYCTTADDVSLLVNWGFPDGSAGADLLTIHTALAPVDEEEPPPTTVPEPATLSLLGLGCASFLLRHRRAKTPRA